MQALGQSGRGFAAAALGMETPDRPVVSRRWLPDREFVCLAALMGCAILVRRRPGAWTRRTFLLASLTLTGLLLNLQYSTQHVMALLSFHVPGVWLSGAFFLILLGKRGELNPAGAHHLPRDRDGCRFANIFTGAFLQIVRTEKIGLRREQKR